VSERIFARFRTADFLPPYMGFGDPKKTATATFTLLPGARHVLWYRRHGDAVYRDNCTFPLTTYTRSGADFVLDEVRQAVRNSVSAVRDVFFADNRDCTRGPPGTRDAGTGGRAVDLRTGRLRIRRGRASRRFTERGRLSSLPISVLCGKRVLNPAPAAAKPAL
jgi:hypothetical protein